MNKKLRVAHFSFSDTVGAFGAAYELHDYMRKNGIDSHFFVRDKTRNDDSVIQIGYNDTQQERVLRTINLLYFQYNQTASSLGCNLDEIGIEWTNEREACLRGYDIFHLHWVTGLLSIDNIVQLLQIGKPIVWTMHDFHPFTSICHCPLTCMAFKSECGDCIQLVQKQNEAVQLEWKRKREAYQNGNICVVAASEWLKSEVEESAIFGNNQCKKIPIGINENIFTIKNKQMAKKRFGFSYDEKVILIGAQWVAAALKGYADINTIMKYVLEDESCRQILEQNKLRIAIFGGGGEKLSIDKIPVSNIGFLTNREELCDLYNASDVFLFPSKQETFGMTAAEAMFCGTPVVAFEICAMKEVICNGVNGYCVDNGNLHEMAGKIVDCLKEEDFNREACRELMMSRYTLQIEAESIVDLYKELLIQDKTLVCLKKADMDSGQRDTLIQNYLAEIVQKRAINQNKKTEVPAIYDKNNPIFMPPMRKVRELQNRGKLSADIPIYIFGAGYWGRQMCNALKEVGMKPSGFWDNDKNKWGKEADGYFIMAPQPYKKGNKKCILVAGESYADIEAQLCKLGYTAEEDFF